MSATSEITHPVQAARDDAFHKAFVAHDYGRMEELYRQGINIDYSPGSTLQYLNAAIFRKEVEMVEWLLEHGANPNGVTFKEEEDANRVSRTPLSQAIDRARPNKGEKEGLGWKSARMIDALLAHRADVNLKRGNHRSPLGEALERDYFALALRLVNLGADVDEVATFFDEPAVVQAGGAMASEQPGGRELFDAIMAKKPNLNWRCENYTEPLPFKVFWAEDDENEVPLRFIESGTLDLTATDTDGHNLMARAASMGKLAVMKALRKQGMVLDGLTTNPANPEIHLDLFALAASGNHVEVMDYLWQEGIRFHPGSASLAWETLGRKGHHAALQWAIEHGAPLEEPRDGHTPLTWCVEKNDPVGFGLLLKAGTDPSPPGMVSVAERLQRRGFDGWGIDEFRSHLLGVESYLEKNLGDAKRDAGVLPQPPRSWAVRIFIPARAQTPLIDDEGKATSALLLYAGSGKLEAFFQEQDWKGREGDMFLFHRKISDALPPHYRNRLQETVDISWARRELFSGSVDGQSKMTRWAVRPGAARGIE